RAEAQGQPTIKIVSPAAGATVTGPVTLQVAITGATVKPAAEGDPQAFHYHALVDVDRATVVQDVQPLPTGQASIIQPAAACLAPVLAAAPDARGGDGWGRGAVAGAAGVGAGPPPTPPPAPTACPRGWPTRASSRRSCGPCPSPAG